MVRIVTRCGLSCQFIMLCICYIFISRINLFTEIVFFSLEGKKHKEKNWEENDFYDSDEDSFLDRTGSGRLV